MLRAAYSSPDFVDWGQPVNWSHSLARGLLLWLRSVPNRMGWGSTKWRDMRGRYPATLTGGPTWTDPKGRPAWGSLSVPGDDGIYASVSSPPNPTTALSYGCWLRTTTTGKVAMSRLDSVDEWQIYIQDASNVRLAIAGTYLTVAASVADGAWHRVDCTWDGSTIRAIIDGNEHATTAAHGSGITYGSTTLYLGRNTTALFPFNGDLDDVTVFDRRLTPADGRQLYNETRTFCPRLLNRYAPSRNSEQAGAGGASKLIHGLPLLGVSA